MKRGIVSVGLAILMFASATIVAAGGAQAAPGAIAKVHCHGDPAFWAEATWTWTVGGNQVPGGSLKCNGGQVVTGDPNRPAGATAFTVVVTGLNPDPTQAYTVSEAVDPLLRYSYNDHFDFLRTRVGGNHVLQVQIRTP